MEKNDNTIACPQCGHTNLQGEEECSHCLASLVPEDRSPDRRERSFMTRDKIASLPKMTPTRIAVGTPVRDAVAALKDQPDGCVMVMDGERLVGIFTQRDVLYKVAGQKQSEAPIERLMTAEPVRIHTRDSVSAAFNKMSVGGFRHLPVFDDDEKLVSQLTMSSLLQYLAQHLPA
jgi:CBS domain-containing protein